jgi:hypothetical protein
MSVSLGQTGRVRSYGRRLLLAGGVAMLLALGFDSLPGVRSVQIAPWTGVLAVALLPLALILHSRSRGGPVRRAVLLFAGFALAHSIVALGLEGVCGSLVGVRVLAWARQVAALGAGVATFVVAQAVVAALGRRKALALMAVSAVPSVLLAGVSLAATAFSAPGLLGFEKRVRLAFVPLGYTWKGRVSGFSIEPSYLAFFLAVAALPAAAALIASGERRARRIGVPILAAGSVTLVGTLSGTGLAVVAAMLLGASFTRWRRIAVWTMTAVVAGSLGLIALGPGNYLGERVLDLAEGVGEGQVGRMDVTALNTLAGTVGPFLRSGSSLVLLGYGLGGTATHLDDILPRSWEGGVRKVSWAGMPNLRSLTGRVFAEAGAVGLVLFVAIFVAGARALRRLAGRPGAEGALAAIGPLVMLGLFLGLALKFGSFALPYLWVWLALAEPAPPLSGRTPARRLAPDALEGRTNLRSSF